MSKQRGEMMVSVMVGGEEVGEKRVTFSGTVFFEEAQGMYDVADDFEASEALLFRSEVDAQDILIEAQRNEDQNFGGKRHCPACDGEGSIRACVHSTYCMGYCKGEVTDCEKCGGKGVVEYEAVAA